ncbi:MAG: 50S ribosomal protein L15 [Chloroflexi bacterium]|jgi:large subunit ribosomal protein L15|nr:50S ribosomal protein L15 [Chloroflexota bacterium]MBT4073266.1 50S ribosomal protein L15 [Chloroflexota bacterium]MBT4516188.1 50S ribosomal protein L15 [Chloroflexota bacterium]MBT6682026.1 50S ribosomal protein L15 [Chloroflexota bacterium]
MGLHDLKPARGSVRARRRVGRGDGSGRGTYSTRGSKGQKQRTSIKPFFEGGQLPLVKRLPYMRGFNNKWRTEYVPINVSRLEVFDTDAEVGPVELATAGIITKPGEKIKILGDGDLSTSLQVSAHGFSKSARTKIEAAGGSVVVIE